MFQKRTDEITKLVFTVTTLKSADKWSQNWQLRRWETFMAPKRPLPWFHLQILLQTKKALGSSAANSGSSQTVQHHLGISLIRQHAHHSSDLPSKLHHSSMFWERIKPHRSIKIREMDLFKAENAWKVYSIINIWQEVQVFSQEKPCAWNNVLLKGRMRGSDHGSFTPHMDHLIWHRSKLLVFKLIPRQYLWHQPTYWQKHISKQQTLPAHKKMNNGGFVDTKISRALTRSLGQLHNISFLEGKHIFEHQMKNWSKKSTWRKTTK